MWYFAPKYLTELNVRPKLPLFLTAGFRFFFLAAAILSLVAIAVWTLWFSFPQVALLVPGAGLAIAPQHWHAHEMIFGYAVAVLAGFFLTAVPNWTGEPEARSNYIVLVGGLWLLGRLVIWFAPFIPALFVALVDLSFIPFLSSRLALNLLKRPKKQNTALLGLLVLIFIGNVLVHFEWTGMTRDTAQRGLWLALFAVCAFIAVIGGRIVPAFTRNAMVRRGLLDGLPVTQSLAERSGIISAVVLGPMFAVGAPDILLGLVSLAAAVANGWRLASWKSRATGGDPLLWSLHLGFAMLVLGYALLAIAWLTTLLSPVSALHGLSIGAVGGMTIAMMTRAPLGHTGRPLRVGPMATGAYILIALAMTVRIAGAEILPEYYGPAILVSGLLWVCAFSLYLAAYWPVLTGPALSAQQF